MSNRLTKSTLFALTLGLFGCGDGLTGTTSAPTSSTGGATPTPAATAAPTATASPGVKSCALAPQSNCSTESGPYEFGCCTGRNIENATPAFVDAIAEAQDFVAATRGELFNGSFVKPGSERAYTGAVAKRIVEKNGICAVAPAFIPEDEITLKERQDRGEIFDIIQGNGLPLRRYSSVCLPAIF